MWPELLKLPWLEVSIWSYGFMLATAFIAGLWMATRIGARDGLMTSEVYKLGLCLIPSALLGAKLMAFVADWLQHGQLSLRSIQGSGAFLGGLLMALAVSGLLMRAWHLSWLKTADAFAPSIAFGYAIARIGCFMAGCCWGKPTNSMLGVRFTAQAHKLTGTPIHCSLIPTQLMESATSLLILAFLLWLMKRRSFNGQIILAYLALYSMSRLTIEYLRDNPPSWIAALSLWQLISVVLFLLAGGFYKRLQGVEAISRGAKDGRRASTRLAHN